MQSNNFPPIYILFVIDGHVLGRYRTRLQLRTLTITNRIRINFTPDTMTTLCFLLLLGFYKMFAKAEETSIYEAPSMNLTGIPDDIPADVEEIHLAGNSFVVIRDYAFSRSQLTEVNLASCGIENISELAFQGSPLISLYLEYNELKAAPNLTAVKSTLQTLSLSGNPLLVVDSPSGWNDYVSGFSNLETLDLLNINMAVFPNLDNVALTLKTLDLSTNDIAIIPPEKFENMASLRILRLKENKLNTFPDFSLLPSNNVLRELNLQRNDIEVVSSAALANFPKLSLINLDGNRLTEFPDFSSVSNTLKKIYLSDNHINLPYHASCEALLPLSALTHLNVGHNNLTGLPPVSVDTLTSLSVINIPLECDCRSAWIKAKEESLQTFFISKTPCVRPDVLVGRLWSRITVQELCPGEIISLGILQFVELSTTLVCLN